jgi:hypothetical protein
VPYREEETDAGIGDFEKFGIMNTIDALAQGDVTKWDQVLEQPNSTIFLKRLMMAQERKYNNDYNEIMKRKR